MKIVTIFGTRPEIIKLSPVIPLLDEAFTHVLIHTGQHYSYNMDKLFFEEMKLRDPDYQLNVGSGSHAFQTGTMMIEIEKIVLQEKPDLILVQGDTNSTLSGALVAAKMGIPLAHIEAGYRSGNFSMPEEWNRVITDKIGKYLFVGIEEGVKHCQREGISEENVYLVGNTAIDALVQNKELAQEEILQKLGVEKEKYALVTFHRADNTAGESLQNITMALNEISEKIPIVFAIHPRTKKAIGEAGIELSEKIHIIDPPGYLDFISLMQHALYIMTDSGGIQEESVELNVPCLILRNETEATNFVEIGKNILTTTQKDKIVELGMKLCDPTEVNRIKAIPFEGKKGVARQIVEILKKELYS